MVHHDSLHRASHRGSAPFCRHLRKRCPERTLAALQFQPSLADLLDDFQHAPHKKARQVEQRLKLARATGPPWAGAHALTKGEVVLHC